MRLTNQFSPIIVSKVVDARGHMVPLRHVHYTIRHVLSIARLGPIQDSEDSYPIVVAHRERDSSLLKYVEESDGWSMTLCLLEHLAVGPRLAVNHGFPGKHVLEELLVLGLLKVERRHSVALQIGSHAEHRLVLLATENNHT